MKSWILLLSHLVWLLLSLKEYICLTLSLRNPEKTQRTYLKRQLRQNQNTDFGIRHQFADIKSIQDYQAKVPLTMYEDYVSYIDALSDGQKSVLTCDPVLMFELSSGSTAASKMIPYTKGLKHDFQRGISAWIFNLYTHHRRLLFGTSYWSITPVSTNKTFTRSGIPVGFEDDTDYFGFIEKYVVNNMMAVPAAVKYISDIPSFHYATLFFLLKDRRLSLISIWNPTFLLILLDQLEYHWHSLIADIEHGRLSLPNRIDDNIYRQLVRKIQPDPARADELRPLTPREYNNIWPKLSLISCWRDGNALPYYNELRRRMGDIPFQAKGLLATEAFVSFPLVHLNDGVLAIRSHFFEFKEAGSSDIKGAHQLETGKTYSVIVTTGGGFYRYQLQDMIEVVGFEKKTPVIRFLGKADKVVDHFGEKLNEAHVSEVLRDTFNAYSLNPRFFLLAYDDYKKQCYTLYMETSEELPLSLASYLDQKLRENFHYDYCRKLGQLKEPHIFRIKKDGMKTYLDTCEENGQKLGDIKPVALHTYKNWSLRFHGVYIERAT
ncbi:MAG: GH3 auxin-responsive promoter family protein [Bacillaceae bacterium]|nr:GH3 auxin-responsive promoter family protein [Bacillaceae bacterium]